MWHDLVCQDCYKVVKVEVLIIAATNVKVESLLRMLTIKLRDDNVAKWSFQFNNVCPPRFVIHKDIGVTSVLTAAYFDWESTDLTLLSLLLATLSRLQNQD
ncbi:hypothetical protein DVH24_021723 [Malus domestica]|uniref:Uncharacterized protein n=1 Tax=Malus domestica TaxID=3750 RepID=A0A498K3S2_MALDO|nr:hypothetical protein DVH24_021723 [Malus domestica]